MISDIERRWFTQHLTAAREPSLYERQAPGTIRFIWLRTFHSPIIVRVTGIGGPRPRLVAKQLSGQGGYEPGQIAASIDRRLSIPEARRLQAALAHGNVLPFSSNANRFVECGFGTDGAEWIVEAVDRQGYHVAKQWSPDKGAIREVGLMLVALTGWKVGKIY